jgi:1,4-alpha-glucan branching enzyme
MATKVELMGDFTDWQPVEMARQNSTRWRVRLAAEPGVHYLNVRYDGGIWQPPPRANVIHDEFGKETGVLLID